jgi:hypothetical protein
MEWQEAGGNCLVMSFLTSTLLNTIIKIKSNRMRWAGHVARMGEAEEEEEENIKMGLEKYYGVTWLSLCLTN